MNEIIKTDTNIEPIEDINSIIKKKIAENYLNRAEEFMIDEGINDDFKRAAYITLFRAAHKDNNKGKIKKIEMKDISNNDFNENPDLVYCPNEILKMFRYDAWYFKDDRPELQVISTFLKIGGFFFRSIWKKYGINDLEKTIHEFKFLIKTQENIIDNLVQISKTTDIKIATEDKNIYNAIKKEIKNEQNYRKIFGDSMANILNLFKLYSKIEGIKKNTVDAYQLLNQKFVEYYLNPIIDKDIKAIYSE
ncbi:hypothetical protein ACFL1H_02840 [Nanoarchaeota archaeon]